MSTPETLSLSEFKATDYIDDLWDMLSDQRDELATNKDLMVLKPDFNRYRIIEAAGVLLSIAAVVNGVLVGYSINMVAPNMHYGDLVVCQNDVLYVKPEFRGGVGGPLMKMTEILAKDRGARMMVWHAKPDTALEGVLPHMGYEVQDIMFSKEL